MTFRCKALRQASFVANHYIEHVPPNLLLEDAMSPKYWCDVVGGLRVGDLITLIASDDSFDVDVRVTTVSMSGSLSFRLVREWYSDETGNTSKESVVVCRNPEPGAVDWALAKGSPGAWKFPLSAAKGVCVIEAIEQAISTNLATNLTVFSGDPAVVLADPDAGPAGHHVSILCPERANDRHRWVILNRGKNGYSQARILAGQDVVAYLRAVAAEEGEDNRFAKSTFQLRPNLVSSDLLARNVA